MPRQRKSYRRDVHVFPEDFPQRLERLKDESGLTWSELAARLGTSPLSGAGVRAPGRTRCISLRSWNWPHRSKSLNCCPWAGRAAAPFITPRYRPDDRSWVGGSRPEAR